MNDAIYRMETFEEISLLRWENHFSRLLLWLSIVLVENYFHFLTASRYNNKVVGGFSEQFWTFQMEISKIIWKSFCCCFAICREKLIGNLRQLLINQSWNFNFQFSFVLLARLLFMRIIRCGVAEEWFWIFSGIFSFRRICFAYKCELRDRRIGKICVLTKYKICI